jgi:hypothetical protein
MPKSPSGKPAAEIDKTSARRFPLVHKLIHFADLRNFYRDMREALISANRRAGAQRGLVTKAKKKIAELEAEMAQLEQERGETFQMARKQAAACACCCRCWSLWECGRRRCKRRCEGAITTAKPSLKRRSQSASSRPPDQRSLQALLSPAAAAETAPA